MLHFHEAVGHDGAGRIEAAIAYAGHLEPSGELSLRLRPAGREAYLPAPAALQTYPQVLRLYDAIERWLEGQAGSCCAGSPYEIHRAPAAPASMSPTPSHPEAPCGTCPYIGSGPYCYANSFAMMFGEHAPSTAVIEFATGSPFGMQMLGARCRCSIPMAGIRTLASTARWRRWVGVRPQLRRQRGRGAGTTARRAGAWSCLDRSGRDGILQASAWHDGADPGRSLCRRAGDRGLLRADARPARLPYATLPLADFMAAWAADTVDYGAPTPCARASRASRRSRRPRPSRRAAGRRALARHGSATSRSRRHAGQRRRRRSAGGQAARRLRRRAPDASDPFRGPRRRASRQRRGGSPGPRRLPAGRRRGRRAGAIHRRPATSAGDAARRQRGRCCGWRRPTRDCSRPCARSPEAIRRGRARD